MLLQLCMARLLPLPLPQLAQRKLLLLLSGMRQPNLQQ